MRSILPTLFLGLATSLFASACVDGDEGDCEGEECHAHDEDLFSQAYEENLEDPKADTADCSGVRVPDRSGFGKKIALTFDDGPNPATTPKVIEVLKRHRAPAAFFTNGSRYGTAGARELAARIAADPDYILANHSQNHKNLSQESASSVASEFTRTDALIRAAGETPKYFRFPFGASTCASKTYIQGQNNIVTGWHVDSADWCYARGDGYCKKSTFRYVPDEFRDDMGAYILSQVRSTNGGIVLFHDVHQSTADNLDAILTALENEGYTFVRLDNTAVFPRLHGTTAAPQKFIGDACTTDAQCGFTASGQAGKCHAAGFCTISCAGSCPDLAGKAGTFCIADARTTNAGICVSKAASQNNQCSSLPGTSLRVEQRFIGTSGATAATANVCAPR